MQNKLDLVEEQLKLEAEMFGSGIARFDKSNERAIKSGSASDTDWFRRLTKAFIVPFSEAIQAYLDYYENRAGKPSKAMAYLRLLDPNISAYVSTKVIFDSLGQADISAQSVAEKVGRRIEDQVRFSKLESTAPKYIAAIKKSLAKRASNSYSHARKVLQHTEAKLADREAQMENGYVNDVKRWIDWPKSDVIRIGAIMIDVFAANVLYMGQPVIEKVTTNAGTKAALSHIRPTAIIDEWIREFREEVGAMSPCYAPCVIKPRDWKTPFNGGYHSIEVSSKLPMVKSSDKSHVRTLTKGQMPKVYQAINALQSVEWAVCSEVYEVAEEISILGLELAMPQAEPYILRDAPVREDLRGLRGAELKEAMTQEEWSEFRMWKREAAEHYDEEQERRSKYFEITRTLQQARRYKEYDKLHFVYTADFRGRLYCQSSLISPQGSDLQKALLRFSKGMKLGCNGRFWLAVQGAGVWGEDKSSFPERVAFIEAMSEDIRDFAASPLSFTGWAGADKPWQFLNFCFEWASLLDWEESGNATEDFVSHIPVAMDGSCSGIQHYSALLRDPTGGAAVNLLPSDKPNDIYGIVSDSFLSKLKLMTASERVTPEQARMADLWLKVEVSRDMTKKPVMTLPYGSTQLTCRASVTDYVKKLEKTEYKLAKLENRPIKPVHFFESDENSPFHLFKAESFASSGVWKCIGENVKAAVSGMAFIKSVTAKIAKANHPLTWETPTGFIVKQAIMKQRANRVETTLMGRVGFTIREETDQIDPVRMKSACAPNYIHSFDGSHLTLAVCDFEDNGIASIAVIHDSFGTHAGATDKLRYHLKRSFVDMYQKCDWLHKFKEDCEDQINQEIEVEVPEPMGLELEDIMDSDYIFG